ncbi:MAG TPA: glycosyltransferase family protein, partial [Thermoanaerobaculia bacterium]|nr:glycosyltransferase family protein [Thermoanaerobaculia bacterium]
MKILYGVVGEGMGHAMRSRVVLEYLLSRGHEIEIMASSRAADFLAARFRGVRRIHGFHIVYEENRMKLAATVRSNLRSTAATLPANIRAYFELVEQFDPSVVISDF